MATTQQDAVRIATQFIEERGWREHWSLKRVSAKRAEHPEQKVICWRVHNNPPGLGTCYTTVWLDYDSGVPLSASRIQHRAWPEFWHIA